MAHCVHCVEVVVGDKASQSFIPRRTTSGQPMSIRTKPQTRGCCFNLRPTTCLCTSTGLGTSTRSTGGAGLMDRCVFTRRAIVSADIVGPSSAERHKMQRYQSCRNKRDPLAMTADRSQGSSDAVTVCAGQTRQQRPLTADHSTTARRHDHLGYYLSHSFIHIRTLTSIVKTQERT